MKYLATSLLTLISLSLWASGKPGDALKELDSLKRQFSTRQGSSCLRIEALNDDDTDDDDDYPFGYTNVEGTPLPFSGINAPPPDICTESSDEDILNGTWPVPQSGTSILENEIEKLKAMSLDALKKKPPKSDWERLQEAAQSTLRPASNPTPEQPGLNVFVGIESAAVKVSSPPRLTRSLPPLPLKRRPSPKKKATTDKRDKYKQRMMNCSVLPDLPTIEQNKCNLAQFKNELLQLRHSLHNAEADRRASKDEKEILKITIQIEKIKKLIQDKMEDENKEAKKITLEGYLSQYLKKTPEGHPTQRLRKTQITNSTPKLSLLGQIYVVPHEDQDISVGSYEDWRSVLTESNEIDDLPYFDSDTDVDSPPVARRPQSDHN